MEYGCSERVKESRGELGKMSGTGVSVLLIKD
jgi:hypothetical protein